MENVAVSQVASSDTEYARQSSTREVQSVHVTATGWFERWQGKVKLLTLYRAIERGLSYICMSLVWRVGMVLD